MRADGRRGVDTHDVPLPCCFRAKGRTRRETVELWRFGRETPTTGGRGWGDFWGCVYWVHMT